MGTTPSRAWFSGLLLSALAAGCGSAGSGFLDVGSDDGGPSFAGSADGGGPGPFDAHIEQNHIAITFVTLSCTGPCADVVAVPTGGQAPYTFAWDDGSTRAGRHVCPAASTSYSVKVTDTGKTGELSQPAQTVQVPLEADVIACPDGGTTRDGGADGPVAPSVYWATWSQVTSGAPGSATGTLSPPQGDVQVSYAGEVGTESLPTGMTIQTALGATTFAPASTFLSATVGNAPPPTGMIAVDGSAMLTQTITFSVPVQDPLLAILSMGDGSLGSTMQFEFDATPTVLSSGAEMVGTLALSGSLTASGQTLSGIEGTGVVQLTGTFRSITFTIPMKEVGGSGYLTVGIRGRG